MPAVARQNRRRRLCGGLAGVLWLSVLPADARADELFWQPDVPLLLGGLMFFSMLLSVLYWYVHRRSLLRRIETLEHSGRTLRSAFDALPDPVTIKADDGRYLDCNAAFLALCGVPRDAVVGQTASDLFPAPVALRILAQDRLALGSGEEQHVEDWIQFPGQRPRLFHFLRRPFRSGDNSDSGLLLVGQDITQNRHEEVGIRLQSMTLDCLMRGESLNTVLERLVRMVEGAYPEIACSVMLLDKDQRLRLAAAPNLNADFVAATDGMKAVEGAGACGTAAATGRRMQIEDIQQHPYWEAYSELARSAGVAACWSEPVLGSQGEVLGTFCIYSSEPSLPTPAQLKLIEQAVRLICLAVERSRREDQLRKLSRAVEQSSSMVIILDAGGNIEYVNDEFCELTGYSQEEVPGRPLSLLQADEADDELYREMWRVLQSGEDWHGEVRSRRKNGELFWSTLSVSPIVEDDGSLTHFVGISEDISAQKQSQAQIEQLAFYDPLTQLGNRRLFREQLDQELRKVRRSGQQLALFYLDLDNFKQINDTLGHDVGDRLLQAIAGRLRQTLRESDIIARLGGDEFIILLPQVQGPAQARQVAEKLLQALLTPVTLGAHEVLITFSIGITLAPGDGDTWSVLMKNADLAMYRAKRQGATPISSSPAK
ncbi:bifunctional diguanylate cyclase/phosphodiesterase [Marinobacterium aestuariivivens]|uniref:Diguanylate cyclase domain-containing protein n=1 Tax=Marinobacterium aestuariivivens TaxID=1698799 RepID=A0ABW1ZY31_9GAMM